MLFSVATLVKEPRNNFLRWRYVADSFNNVWQSL